MKNRFWGWLVLAALLVVLAYAASPYWAAYRFKHAAMSADVDRLDAAVDFPAVRESLKSDLSAALIKNMNDDPAMKQNPFAGLGVMMMPVIVDKMVDTFVTPSGIAAMAKGEKPASKPTDAVS